MSSQQDIKFWAIIVDSEGEAAITTVYTPFLENDTFISVRNRASTWGARLQACISGQLQSVHIEIPGIIYSYDLPSPGIYGDIEDKAALTFRSLDNGSAGTYELATPKAGILMGDAETIDPAEPSMLALIQWYEANARLKSGSSNLRYIAGMRRRSKSRKERPGIAPAIG